MTETTPSPVSYVRDALAGFGAPWFLCGGWAADAWLGRTTREHGDVDIGVFHRDHRRVFEHLSGWALVAHDPNVADDTTEPWNGRPLDLPAHVHVPKLGSVLATSTAATHSAYEFEFVLNELTEDRRWILDRERRIAVPLDDAVRPSPWGMPTAAPEIVIFYKAADVRPRDEQDFFALVPTLNADQRRWLRDALGAAHPDHPWLPLCRGLV